MFADRGAHGIRVARSGGSSGEETALAAMKSRLFRAREKVRNYLDAALVPHNTPS